LRAVVTVPVRGAVKLGREVVLEGRTRSNGADGYTRHSIEGLTSFLKDTVPVNSSTFVSKVVCKLNADVVTPVSLDGGAWELPVDHQAGNIYAIRSASLLGNSPVIFACYASYRVVRVVICIRVSKTPRLAAR
jgi:hypothetical protein